MLEGIIKSDEDPFIRDEFNPLLRGTEEQGFAFASDPDEEHSFARYFLDEINSGRLSVRDAYEKHWSYEEEESLWGVGGKALLPDWKPILLEIAPHLHIDKAKELVEVLSESYLRAAKTLDKDKYNPFFDDMYAALKIMSVGGIKDGELTDRIYNAFFSLDIGETTFEKLFDSKEFDHFLIEMVKSNTSIRDKHSAISLLGKHKAQEATDTLVSYLDSDDPEKHRAAMALGRIGTPLAVDRASQFFIDVLNRTEPKRKATKVVLDYGGGHTSEHIFKNVTDPKEILRLGLGGKPTFYEVEIVDPETKDAILALGNIGGRKSLDFLLGKYESYKERPSDFCMQETIVSILRVGDAETRKRIYEELGRDNEELNKDIFSALVYAKPGDAQDYLVRYIRADKKYVADYAMGLLKKENKERAYSVLVEYMNDETKRERGAAAKHLGGMVGSSPASFDGIGDKRAIPHLVKFLQSQLDKPLMSLAQKGYGEDVKAAVHSLVQLGVDSAVPLLLRAIPVCDTFETGYVLHGIERLDGSAHIDHLVGQLDNPNSHVRTCALELLSKSGYKPTEKVREIAKSDPFWYIRNGAVTFLGKYPTRENLDALHDIVNNFPSDPDHSLDYVNRAISILAKEDLERVKPRLIELSSHSKWIMTWGVAKACEYGLHDPEIKSLLHQMLDRDDDYMTSAAIAQVFKKANDMEGIVHALNICRRYQDNPPPDIDVPSGEKHRQDTLKGFVIEGFDDITGIPEDTILDLLGHEKDTYSRQYIIDLLANNSTQRSLPTLFKFLGDQEAGFSARRAIQKTVTRDWLLQNNICLNDYGAYAAKEMHEGIKPQGYNPSVEKLVA